MKQFIAAIVLVISSMAASAQCNTHTIMSADGKVTICTTCCYNGNCNTTCF